MKDASLFVNMLTGSGLTLSSPSLSPIVNKVLLFIQGEATWVETSAYQDAHFVVDVRYADTSSLLLQFETAPAQDSILFSPMVAGLDLVPLVGLSKAVDCYANAVSGPPLASWLRWAIYGSANWTACFRISMVAL